MAKAESIAADTSWSPKSACSRSNRDQTGECIKGRYAVSEAIGKGGMAAVYRAHDLVENRDVALKKLVALNHTARDAETASLFEREFRTLAHLSHPRIIEVYDFGIDDEGPFYTMELLDGGDLRDRTPLGWRDACRIAYDVCSSLALLHSRRLLHRDVTPRNVRCTREGEAKLIDFGAMVPMGAGSVVVGTPRFLAPEVLYRSHLDARTDLFSLGATLYYTLTGQFPYSAHDLTSAPTAWRDKPRPPSAYVAEIPPSLDVLILSMLGVDPASRPRTAFEVMHRLAAIAGLEFREPPLVPRSYLATPVLVGRDEALDAITRELQAARAGAGRSVLVEGEGGLGRTRVLDAFALVAQTLGWRVLRADSAAALDGAFRTIERLATQLVDDTPDLAARAARAARVTDILFENGAEVRDGLLPEPALRDLRSSTIAPFELKRALGDWLSAVSDQEPLAVCLDDMHAFDEASLGVIAAMAAEAQGHRLFLLGTADPGVEPTDRLAFDAFASRSARVSLEPLSRANTERLIESVFGDVPEVGALAERIHAIARGNPRASMDLAQHLVDRKVLRYERGAWTLPEGLDASDLPHDAAEAIAARLRALRPPSRSLVEAQALATYRRFTRDDYARLAAVSSVDDVDGAITELVAHRIVTSDGRVYSLAHPGYREALLASMTDEQQAERHRALVVLYEGKLPLGVARHALFAGLEQRALDELAPLLPGLAETANLYELTDLGAFEVAATLERALAAAERLDRSPLELNHLRRWLCSLGVVSDDKYYFLAAPDWLTRLKRDSGHDLWESLADVADPGDRLSRTMQGAFARYLATPEHERVYRPDEAVRGLVHFAGISMAIASARLDSDLVLSLSPLLAPFAPIAPIVSIVWRNTLAACENAVRAGWERAYELWIGVHRDLFSVEDVDPHFLGVFQRAVAFAIGMCELAMGIPTAVRWADRLDDDPVQCVNGVKIRRIACLEQGDAERAEAFRKRAEVLSLQARSRQMFHHLEGVELVVAALARDLTLIKRSADRLRVLAARAPRWTHYVDLADGLFHLVCEDFEGARGIFDRTSRETAPVAGSDPLPTVWCHAVAGLVEALTALGRLEDARACGEEALDVVHRLEIGVAAHGIVRALAVAEARAGALETATRRLDEILEVQKKMGVSGLHLAAVYADRARVAIASKDVGAFDEYTRLAAQSGNGIQALPSTLLERLKDEGHTLMEPSGMTLDAAPSSMELDMETQQLSTVVER
jgi:hypothetical protein